MKKAAEYLLKFKNLRPPRKLVEKEAAKILSGIFGSDWNFEISYKKPDLTIKTGSSVLKNEIFIRKNELVEKIKKSIQEEGIKVRFK